MIFTVRIAADCAPVFKNSCALRPSIDRRAPEAYFPIVWDAIETSFYFVSVTFVFVLYNDPYSSLFLVIEPCRARLNDDNEKHFEIEYPLLIRALCTVQLRDLREVTNWNHPGCLFFLRPHVIPARNRRATEKDFPPFFARSVSDSNERPHPSKLNEITRIPAIRALSDIRRN